MITHGFTKSQPRLYRIWRSMKRRCLNPNDTHYNLYGGKGIKICDEWYNPVNFITWALNNGYADNLSIDRLDANGNYEPQNCRWATSIEQNCHRSIRKDTKTGYVGITPRKTRKNTITFAFEVAFGGVRFRKEGFATIKDALEARNQIIKDNNFPIPIQEYKE